MQRSDVACVTQSGFKRLCLSPLLTLPSQRGPSLQVFLLWAPPSTSSEEHFNLMGREE